MRLLTDGDGRHARTLPRSARVCRRRLELGAAAEQAYRHAIAVARTEPAAYVGLALEYAYRGAWAEAERAYAQAPALVAGLPPLAAMLTAEQEPAVPEA